jgi:sarcosine oxidase subunit beta
MELWEHIEDLVGDDCGFESHGTVLVAENDAELAGFRARVDDLRLRGFSHEELIDRAELKRLVPAVADHCPGGVVSRRDGAADPFITTQAFRRRAIEKGAQVIEGATVTGLVRSGSGWRAETSAGPIEAPKVVNAAGAWAAGIAAWAGVNLPVKPYRRHCFTTHPMPWVSDRLPMIVDMGSGVYMHRESGGLLMGMADREEPSTFDESTNWDFVEQVVGPAIARVPALEAAEIRAGWAGLYETTPDHNAVLGPPQGVTGLMLANGFSGHGFMQAPGVGQLIAEWIVEGRPSLDLHELRLERFREHADMVEANVI